MDNTKHFILALCYTGLGGLGGLGAMGGGLGGLGGLLGGGAGGLAAAMMNPDGPGNIYVTVLRSESIYKG